MESLATWTCFLWCFQALSSEPCLLTWRRCNFAVSSRHHRLQSHSQVNLKFDASNSWWVHLDGTQLQGLLASSKKGWVDMVFSKNAHDQPKIAPETSTSFLVVLLVPNFPRSCNVYRRNGSHQRRASLWCRDDPGGSSRHAEHQSIRRSPDIERKQEERYPP